ncbi:hypothetical protein [Xylella fastidiosa]|uniref:hypothetical protein n=1 Tax=Xylella fastidiosa TaxID=2371 RepID=UPI0024166492|nr:hypothetical protein [Xylella fastidiosa]MDG4872835.1 hypothetical protein [Xylella fastidiosa subsp. multiplex]
MQRLAQDDPTGLIQSGNFGMECIEIPALIDDAYVSGLAEQVRKGRWCGCRTRI